MNQECVLYHFKCNLCDGDFIDFINQLLYQRIEEHKEPAIKRRAREQHGRNASDTEPEKFGSLIYEMLFVRELKQNFE